MIGMNEWIQNNELLNNHFWGFWNVLQSDLLKILVLTI